MKRIISNLLCILAVFTFVSCGKTNNIVSENNKIKTANNKDNDTSDEETLTLPSELPYEIEILPPNSIGTIYGDLTYTNSGKYPITMLQLSIQYTKEGGGEEKTYFTSHDTVMPEEKSFGTKTFCSSDWKPLKLDYIIYDEEIEKYKRISYDYKLDKLKQSKWKQYQDEN